MGRGKGVPAGVLLGLVLWTAGALLAARPAWGDAFGLELTLLTSHVLSQRDAPVETYTRRLDRDGRHVFTPGLEAYYDRDLVRPLWGARQWRIAGGLVSDSAEHRFVYLALMGRWVLWARGRAVWSLQLGPGLLARESWRDIPGYDPDNLLNESADFMPGYEWAVLPLGDLDLLLRLAPGLELVWSVFPGLPFVITQGLGLRWSF